ncbi:type I 3-dehydroquinate dehydratase [Paenibacillus hemerocallicola]|uniref:Type I 3-dehydroquinate dehydratase n=1 Tax=Paenibacillus hemerocallicola TaxID=1172614 RepID=A0A5C4T212_9BACL|nr:type I 3-dehydroquinate dehydratase [Paenibacillus hemerocallicola]
MLGSAAIAAGGIDKTMSNTKGEIRLRPSFAKLPQPFIVNVIREKDPESAIASIKNAEYDGAIAHDLHLTSLGQPFHNYKDLRRIIASTANPQLILNYRYTNDMSDEERIKRQILAIEAGAAAIDIPADTFDPNYTSYGSAPEGSAEPNANSYNPKELSMDPAVIEKQMKLIETVHSMGAEVLLSSHTRVVMSSEQVVSHALEMQSRGADMVKIVSVCMNEDQLIEAFKSIVALKRTLKVPFQYQCHGEHGKLTRVVGPMLGSMLVFCNQRFAAHTFNEQPLVHAMRSVFQNVDWRIAKPLEEENFNQT